MLKPLPKLLLIITMLVAFMGQTMAYHFIALNEITSEKQTNVQLSNFVENNDNSNASVDDCCQVECCESECICPANVCTSSAYIDNRLSMSDIIFLSEPLLSLATKGTHFIATSLYRPPIFTS